MYALHLQDSDTIYINCVLINVMLIDESFIHFHSVPRVFILLNVILGLISQDACSSTFALAT